MEDLLRPSSTPHGNFRLPPFLPRAAGLSISNRAPIPGRFPYLPFFFFLLASFIDAYLKRTQRSSSTYSPVPPKRFQLLGKKTGPGAGGFGDRKSGTLLLPRCCRTPDCCLSIGNRVRSNSVPVRFTGSLSRRWITYSGELYIYICRYTRVPSLSGRRSCSSRGRSRRQRESRKMKVA